MRLNSRRAGVLGAAVGAWALVSVAGTALAQPDEGVLGGPKVKDNSVPGAKSRFSTGKGDKKERALDRGIPPGVYVKALDALRAEDAPANVRLTPEQDAKITAIQRDFMESERAYMRDHREELASLRKDMPPEMRQRIDERLRGPKALENGAPKDSAKKGRKGAKGDAPPPPPDDMNDSMTDGAPDPAASAKSREQLEKIFDGAPKPKDAQSKVWALLTDAQRPVLQAEIERLQKSGGKGRTLGGPDGGPGGELREKVKNMSPEERQQYLQEMREKRRGNKAADGEDKPPPRRDSVRTPAPDGAKQGPK